MGKEEKIFNNFNIEQFYEIYFQLMFEKLHKSWQGRTEGRDRVTRLAAAGTR